MPFHVNRNNLNCKDIQGKVRLKQPFSKLNEELKELMLRNNLWIESLLQEIPKRWERHGDLLIFPNTAFKNPVWFQFQDAVFGIITSVLSCRRIAIKCKVLSDDYRTPQVRLLNGMDGWVQRIDNGIKFTFDVRHCMFSFGNVTEKLRIAEFDCSGEIVLDLYAGIGYFTLPFLIHAKADHVHACEWNPKAVDALKQNFVLNKISPERYTVHEGDNCKAGLSDIADRVNLGLLPSSRNGWKVACCALKQQSGGILHVHENIDTRIGIRKQELEKESGVALCPNGASVFSDTEPSSVSEKKKLSGQRSVEDVPNGKCLPMKHV